MIRPPAAPYLRCVDWRLVPANQMQALYAAEVRRWAAVLDWDTEASWAEVDRGRMLGTVSGVAALTSDGAVAGWTYYLVQQRRLIVGGFVATTDAVVRALLDRMLGDVPDTVDRISLFVFTDAPGLAAALRPFKLSVDRYWYLGRELDRPASVSMRGLRHWMPDDLPATIDLLHRAYEPADEARPFAPDNTLEDWREYVTHLTGGQGCGTLMLDGSFVVSGGPGRLLGVVFVTRIADATAHVAQIAVDPQVRGRHLGGQLLDAASMAAARQRCRRLTLLVSSRNARARAMYESRGFESMASFVAGGTLHPRRSTSAAPGGVAMTRR